MKLKLITIILHANTGYNRYRLVDNLLQNLSPIWYAVFNCSFFYAPPQKKKKKTEHDFLVGQGLEAFIDEMGLARTPEAELVAEWPRQQLQLMQQTNFLSEAQREKYVTLYLSVFFFRCSVSFRDWRLSTLQWGARTLIHERRQVSGAYIFRVMCD